MTLNGVMAVILRYFTEFGKHAFQHITASICGGIYARVYCILYVRCRRKKFTFVVSSPDEFLVLTCVGSKIMERIIAKCIYNHLANNNLLSGTQHGFIKGRSTCTNLLECMNDWTLSN